MTETPSWVRRQCCGNKKPVKDILKRTILLVFGILQLRFAGYIIGGYHGVLWNKFAGLSNAGKAICLIFHECVVDKSLFFSR